MRGRGETESQLFNSTNDHKVQSKRSALDFGETLSRQRLEAERRRKLQRSTSRMSPWSWILELTAILELNTSHKECDVEYRLFGCCCTHASRQDSVTRENVTCVDGRIPMVWGDSDQTVEVVSRRVKRAGILRTARTDRQDAYKRHGRVGTGG